MAKDNLSGGLLIGGGLAAVGIAAYLFSGKSPKLDDITSGIADFISGILGGIPSGNGGGDGDGGGGDTCVKKTCASTEEWNQAQCKCVKKGSGGDPCVKKTCSSTEEWNQAQCKCVAKTPTGGGGGGGSIVIGAAGDYGSARSSNWKPVVAQMVKEKVQVALLLGDYSYGSASQFKPVVDAMKKGGMIVRGAEGNHDSGFASYASQFPQSGAIYTFNAGPACIIILNTEASPSANVAFAEKTLNANKLGWKILAMHKPLYTAPSKHGAETALASALKPIILKYGVQLVMYGHDHNYQRIQRPDHPKTVFICSGTGGESHYGINGTTTGTKYNNDSTFGFTKVSISGNSLKGQFMDTSGKVLDSWTQGVTSANVAYSYSAMEEPIGMRISI